MKLFNKIISIICAVSIFAGTVPAFAISSQTSVYVNEVFDNIATNASPEMITVKSGLNARIVETGKTKAFYAAADGCPVKFSIPLKQNSSKMVVSYDIMLSGAPVKGAALGLSGSKLVDLLRYMPTHEIFLEDGMRISGYSSGRWSSYAAAIDFDNGTYDLYIDGKQKLSKRRFKTVPSLPASIDFSFNCINEDDSAEIYLDNIRVYEGNEILGNKFFKSSAKNTTVLDYTPAVRENKTHDKVFIDSNSKSGLSINFVSKEGNVAAWEAIEEDGIPYIHFFQGGSNDCYGDITVDMSEDTTKYVYQIDVYIVNNTGTLRVGNVDNTALTLISLSGKTISHNGVSVGTLEFGKWVTLAAAVDRLNETCAIYKDGKLLKADIPLSTTTVPKKIRVGIASNSNAGTNVYYNRIKLYEGLELRQFDDAEPEFLNDADADMRLSMSSTIHEKASKTQEELGNDNVFMTTSDYFYSSGKKRLYSEYGAKSWVNTDGKVMVDAEVLKFAFDSNGIINDSSLTLSGKSFSLTKYNNSYFADVSDVAKKLGKFVYDGDNRDFVIVSDKNKGYYNSPFSEDHKESVDVIWRYMQFDRPDSEEVFSLLKKNNSYKTHPRLFIKKDDIPQFKRRINSDLALKQSFTELLDKCDQLLNEPPGGFYYQADGIRIFSACTAVRSKLYNLCTAYILTGDKKYAERAWIELDDACSWEHWNLEGHFLDSGEMVPGIAYAYDTLYDYLTDEQKESVRRRVEKLYLDYAVGMFNGTSYDNVSRDRHTKYNWGAVCGSAMLMISLTFMDEEAPDSLFTQKCKYIASGTIQLFEYLATVLAPYGTWYEGGGYSEYVLQSFAWALLSMNNVLGIDNNFCASPGLLEQPIYTMYVTTDNGVFNKSNTTGSDKFFCPEVFIYARLANRPDLMQLYNNYRKSINVSSFPTNYLLFYDPEYVKLSQNALSLDKYYDSIGTAVIRNSWTDNKGLFLAVSGGFTSNYGDVHYDKGSFIFEALGERWFIDLGRNGNTVMPFLVKTETHNALEINPKADYYGQLQWKDVYSIDHESKTKGAKFVYDLAPAYEDDVKYYKRGFLVSDNRNTLVVQDELSLKKASTLQWNFITKADIDISADGKTAILTQAGKTLRVSAAGNISDWKFEVRDMAPTGGWVEDVEGLHGKGTFTIAQQQKFAGTAKKLVVSAKASGNVNMTFKFVPEIEGEPYADALYIPMSEWNIPDGDLPPKPVLDGITVNGQPLAGFIPDVKEYNLRYLHGSSIPVFGATASNGSVEITQAVNWTENAQIKVTLPDGRYTIYRMNLFVEEKVSDDILANATILGLPSSSKLAKVKSVYASHEPELQNPAGNSIDGKFDTRWAADTDGAYIEVDLGSVQNLTGVAVSWASGETRNYKFDILVSENKADYKRIYQGYSTGGTNDFEFINTPVKARFVRYVGYGHKAGPWNSVTEFRPTIEK